MKKVYGFDTSLNTIELSAGILRMEFQLGEGELEIENQGRLVDSRQSFSQETGAIGQQTPRIGEQRPKLKELSAGCALNSNSTPRFFFQAGIEPKSTFLNSKIAIT